MSVRRAVVGRNKVGQFGGREAGHDRGLEGSAYGRRVIAGPLPAVGNDLVVAVRLKRSCVDGLPKNVPDDVFLPENTRKFAHFA